MSFLLLWLALAACEDRKPGLSACITYQHEGNRVACRAACYLVTKPDGGTTGYTVQAERMADEATCKLELERQATHGCQP